MEQTGRQEAEQRQHREERRDAQVAVPVADRHLAFEAQRQGAHVGQVDEPDVGDGQQ